MKLTGLAEAAQQRARHIGFPFADPNLSDDTSRLERCTAQHVVSAGMTFVVDPIISWSVR
jgi:hypothetical protein